MSKTNNKNLMGLRSVFGGGAASAAGSIGARIAADIQAEKESATEQSGLMRSQKARQDIAAIDTDPVDVSEGLTAKKDKGIIGTDIGQKISDWFSIQNDPEIQEELDKLAPKVEEEETKPTKKVKEPSPKKEKKPLVPPPVKTEEPKKGREDMPDPLVLTSKQVEMLERVVWAEAKGEGVEGRNAVRGVILNRIASDRFPNTLEAVLKQKGQFEPVGKVKGNISKISVPFDKLDMQKFEFENYVREGTDASQGSTFFLNKALSKKRGTDFSGSNPIEIGNHTYYSSYKNNEPVVVPYYSHNVVIEG